LARLPRKAVSPHSDIDVSEPADRPLRLVWKRFTDVEIGREGHPLEFHPEAGGHPGFSTGSITSRDPSRQTSTTLPSSRHFFGRRTAWLPRW
jgi:hypothetical protein